MDGAHGALLGEKQILRLPPPNMKKRLGPRTLRMTLSWWLLNGKFILDTAAILHCRERFLCFESLESEEQAADNAGEAGDEQEKPDLCKGMPTDEECGAEAAGRIHADAGDVNPEDVDGHERDADGEACEACGR